VLNGDPKEVGEEIAVEELIETLELSPEQVAVEVNGGLIVRAERAAFQLKESDVVELVTLVGGG
jgi:thiamine biosynthesis protein ThiS